MEKSLKSTIVFNTPKTKALAAFAAVVAAVALPQVFHLAGILSNTGSALGEIFLPMHLAIFMVGLLAGTGAGFAAGLLSPLVSFALTGMPAPKMLGFMMIELAIYGAVSGVLANRKLPSIAKLLIAQVAGRAVRAAVIALCFYLSVSQVNPAIIFTSIKTGLPGIALQWVLVPLIVYLVNKRAENE